MRTSDPEKVPRILASAAQLFAERPFQEVRMGDIAASAKVAKGTLYLHFKDKEELLCAMIAEVSGHRLEDLKGRLPTLEGPIPRLRLLIREAVTFTSVYPHYLDTLLHLDASPTEGRDSAIRHRREQLFDLIEGTIRATDATGTSISTHPLQAASSLLGMMHRVMIMTPRPWPDDLADWIADQFLFGVCGTRRQGDTSD